MASLLSAKEDPELSESTDTTTGVAPFLLDTKTGVLATSSLIESSSSLSVKSVKVDMLVKAQALKNKKHEGKHEGKHEHVDGEECHDHHSDHSEDEHEEKGKREQREDRSKV